jgi:hypothetical protein
VQDPGFDEPSQTLLKNVARDSETALEVVESADAQEDVPDDEHAPPLAHDLEALGHRAVHVGEALSLHTVRLVSCMMECNGLWWVA